MNLKCKMLVNMHRSNNNIRMSSIGRITAWHEGHQKFAVKNLNQQNEVKIKTELVEANKELKIRRRERLKALYDFELANYEKELNDRGLAIFKDKL